MEFCFSHSTTCKALFSLTNGLLNMNSALAQPQPCQPQHYKNSHIGINNKGEILTLQFPVGPFLLKGSKIKKRQHRFTKKKKILLPSSHMGTYSRVGCHLPFLTLGPLLWRWWRYLHHLRRWWRYLHYLQGQLPCLFITTKARNN